MALLFAIVGAQAQVKAQSQAQSQAPADLQGQPPAAGQPAAPDATSEPAAPPPAASRETETGVPNAFRPGLLHELGRMLQDSVNNLNSNLKGASGALENLSNQTNEAVKGAAGAAKDAADLTAGAAGNIVALPSNRVVIGRSRCEAAPNGAPNCRIAANVLCRSKGFGQGSSLDVESAENCPVQAWLSGRSPKRSGCSMETYVIRAACR
jgi:hypothetical protein